MTNTQSFHIDNPASGDVSQYRAVLFIIVAAGAALLLYFYFRKRRK